LTRDEKEPELLQFGSVLVLRLQRFSLVGVIVNWSKTGFCFALVWVLRLQEYSLLWALWL